MLKRISGAKLCRGIEKEERIEVQAFPGATTNCLKHHIQPSILKKPDRFVIYCGINNLNSEDTPEKIANDIIQLGKFVKTEINDVAISGNCPRRDRFNQKANILNQLLPGKCSENGFDFIPHSNINTRLHLNRDGLHLNRKGIYHIGILAVVL